MSRHAETSPQSSPGQRIDKWLWCTRFFRTRSIATQAVSGGKVHLNGERIKPSHAVRVGDRLRLTMQGVLAEFEVTGLPLRRGPASEAQLQYRETAASVGYRAKVRQQHRLADVSRPRPQSRPDKRERRQLMKLQRDQG